MPDYKPYPRLFACGNPSCQKVIGIMNRDPHGNVWLYPFREVRPKGTDLDDLELVRTDFSMLRVGFGVVPCTCGHNTRWYPSIRVLNWLIAKVLEKNRRKDV